MPICAWPGGFTHNDLSEPTVIWFKGSFVCRLSKCWVVKTGLVQTYLLSWANFYCVAQNYSWASQLHKQGFINGPKLYLTESKSMPIQGRSKFHILDAGDVKFDDYVNLTSKFFFFFLMALVMNQVRRCQDWWIKLIEAISLSPSITIDDGANPYNETSIAESGAKKQAGSRIGQNWGSWASKREHERKEQCS